MIARTVDPVGVKLPSCKISARAKAITDTNRTEPIDIFAGPCTLSKQIERKRKLIDQIIF